MHVINFPKPEEDSDQKHIELLQEQIDLIRNNPNTVERVAIVLSSYDAIKTVGSGFNNDFEVIGIFQYVINFIINAID